jgi:hypothetical protein
VLEAQNLRCHCPQWASLQGVWMFGWFSVVTSQIWLIY